MKRRTITERIISFTLAIIMTVGSFVAFGNSLQVSAYSTDYPNTYSNTGNQRLDIVGVAKTQIGYYGPGDDNKYGAYFNHNYVPWCAYFVVWCARQAGIGEEIIHKSGYASPKSGYLNVPTKLRSSGYKPSAGDLIFFDYDHMENHDSHDHIAIVENYNNTTGVVTYINGNTKYDYVKRSTISYNDADICCYGIPNYVSSAPSSYENIGDDLYAYIGNQATGKWVSNINSNVVGATAIGSNNQIWHFIRQSDGSYSILDYGSGNAVDVANYGSTPGTNLQCISHVDNTAQRFYIQYDNGGYRFKCHYADLYFDMGSTYYNVDLLSRADNLNQKFNIQRCDFNGYIPLDLGDNFYKYIENVPTGKWISNISGNAIGANPIESKNQLWKFIKHKDRSYSLVSCYDNKAIDVANAKTDPGTNLQCISFADNTAQRFYIYKINGAYYFRSILSYSFLNFMMDNSGYNLYLARGAADCNLQKFNLIEPDKPIAVKSIDYNGHTYTLYYSASKNWNEAKEWCESNGGYLATVTSSGEQNVIDSLVGNSTSGGYYLGAENITTGNYRWITCENWNYTNWYNGQPNNVENKEHYLGTYHGTAWADYSINTTTPIGFIMETGDNAVPDENHLWDAGAITKAPTETEDGIKTYTCTVCNATKKETIPRIAATGISVETDPAKTDYCVGDTLDTTGLTLSVSYCNGTTKTISSGFTCSPDTLLTEGTQIITITYNGKSTSYSVYVRSQETAPYWGDLNGDFRVDSDDANIILNYLKETVELNEEQLCFADVNLDGYVDITDYTVVIRYLAGKNDLPAKAIGEIELVSAKSGYRQGEEIDANSFTIIVSNKNDSNVFYSIKNGFALSGYDANKAGAQTVSTSYRGKTITFKINIECAECVWILSNIKTPATCSHEGVGTYICEVCGKEKEDIIPKDSDHHNSELNQRAVCEATCGKDGSCEYVCSDCGAVVSDGELTDRPAHKYGPWSEWKEDYNGDTVRHRECEDCGHRQTQTVPGEPAGRTLNIVELIRTLFVRVLARFGIYIMMSK